MCVFSLSKFWFLEAISKKSSPIVRGAEIKLHCLQQKITIALEVLRYVLSHFFTYLYYYNWIVLIYYCLTSQCYLSCSNCFSFNYVLFHRLAVLDPLGSFFIFTCINLCIYYISGYTICFLFNHSTLFTTVCFLLVFIYT